MSRVFPDWEALSSPEGALPLDRTVPQGRTPHLCQDIKFVADVFGRLNLTVSKGNPFDTVKLGTAVGLAYRYLEV
ncbi:hypothetical protein SAMN05216404_11845 [Nitrosospira multiformis]|uniref:Uncharacterized protein n=1 Tax=Nitrosospira multiformis TaxID=1231 RepID=A0A1H8P0U6_9PROT|nr:hypothetical protein SAMN05216404_11845 [Nitrosospira multiformis]